MNMIQINKSRMYGATNLVLKNHSELFAQLGDLVLAHQRLQSGLDVIDQNRQVQEADTSGLTKSKAAKRDELVRRISQFSTALVAHATSTKMVELKTKATYTASDLKTAPDPVLYDIGILLLTLAFKYKADLVKYFVEDAEFTALENMLADFKLAIPQRRVATSVSKVSTGNIGETFNEIDKLLKTEIDVLMAPFQFNHADFYKEYKNARKIVNYSGRGGGNNENGDKPAPEQ